MTADGKPVEVWELRHKNGDCSIATGADSKIARQEQGESTWDPLNASELAPNSARLDPKPNCVGQVPTAR